MYKIIDRKLLRYTVKIKSDKPGEDSIEKAFPTELLALRFIYKYCIKNHVDIQNARMYINEEEA